MANVEFFERAAGVFFLWLIALTISLHSFFSLIPLFMQMSLSSTGLFLVFFLTWGLVYTLLFALAALYFRVADYLRGTDVPLPPHRSKKNRK